MAPASIWRSICSLAVMFLIFTLLSSAESGALLDPIDVAVLDELLQILPGLHSVNNYNWGTNTSNACNEGWFNLQCNGGTTYQRLTVLFVQLPTEPGYIPASVGDCTELRIFIFVVNFTRVEFPSTLQNLDTLDTLQLQNTAGSASYQVFPSWIQNMQLLFTLSFEGFNFGSSSLRPLYSVRGQVRWLKLRNNGLQGEFPEYIQSMTNLGYLDLTGNQFTGPIPSWIGNFKDCLILWLSNNQFNGSIPAEIGGASSVAYLDLSGNQLTGPIPASISTMTKLTTLNLQNNALTGSIPDLSAAVNLTTLNLQSNQLSGPIHPSIPGLPLKTLSLQENLLTGSIPSDIGRLVNLTTLSLYSNRLTGSIPDLTALDAVTSLDLSSNQLSGSIPANMVEMAALRWLNLSNNALSGQIPPTFSNLVTLASIDLSNNQLSGPIPDMTKVIRIHVIYMQGNNLEGNISVVFENLYLYTCDVSMNPKLICPVTFRVCCDATYTSSTSGALVSTTSVTSTTATTATTTSTATSTTAATSATPSTGPTAVPTTASSATSTGATSTTTSSTTTTATTSATSSITTSTSTTGPPPPCPDCKCMCGSNFTGVEFTVSKRSICDGGQWSINGTLANNNGTVFICGGDTLAIDAFSQGVNGLTQICMNRSRTTVMKVSQTMQLAGELEIILTVPLSGTLQVIVYNAPNITGQFKRIYVTQRQKWSKKCSQVDVEVTYQPNSLTIALSRGGCDSDKTKKIFLGVGISVGLFLIILVIVILVGTYLTRY